MGRYMYKNVIYSKRFTLDTEIAGCYLGYISRMGVVQVSASRVGVHGWGLIADKNDKWEEGEKQVLVK